MVGSQQVQHTMKEEDKVRLQRELPVLTVNLDATKGKMKKCLGQQNVMNRKM